MLPKLFLKNDSTKGITVEKLEIHICVKSLRTLFIIFGPFFNPALFLYALASSNHLCRLHVATV